eukprot:447093-Alexandrium_andersonii.AAC.1
MFRICSDRSGHEPVILAASGSRAASCASCPRGDCAPKDPWGRNRPSVWTTRHAHRHGRSET